MKVSRIHAKRLATTALLAILAAAAVAQGGPGGMGGLGGMGRPGQGGPGGGRMGGMPALDRLPSLAQFAGRPEVAAELGLRDDQKQAIGDAVQAMRESMRPPQPGDGDGGPPDFRAMQATRDRAEADADAKVRATLSAAQVKRLGEIQIQSMGLAAALVPSVQTKLGLSDDQKAKLKALVPPRGPGGPGGPGGEMGGPPPGGGMGGGQGGPPPGMQGGGPGGPRGMGGPGGMGGGAARRKQVEAKIAAILTDDQKATLQALGGKPIKLAPPQDRGGMGGPGGPGGGGFGGPPGGPL